MTKLGALSQALLTVSLLAVSAAALSRTTDRPEPATAPSDGVSAEAPATTLAPKNCTYYSDPFHTMVVGQIGYDCCNNRVVWGTTSPFYECGGCFICFPPPQ